MKILFISPLVITALLGMHTITDAKEPAKNPSVELETIERVALSSVNVVTWKDDKGSHGPAIAEAYEQYKGRSVEVVGFRLDPFSLFPPTEAVGRPTGLGSDPNIGITRPVRLGHDSYVTFTGKMLIPAKHGDQLSITGKIVESAKGQFSIEVRKCKILKTADKQETQK